MVHLKIMFKILPAFLFKMKKHFSRLNFSRLIGSDSLRTDEAVYYKGVHLPHVRSNESLNQDDEYIASALELVVELEKVTKIRRGLRILDFGCGQGRLANGLIINKTSNINYHGIDTHSNSIAWCKKHIKSKKNAFLFTHLPAKNARYNPNATALQTLPAKSNSIDCVFLNSVFSHMLPPDIEFYLNEFHRVLKPNGGGIYFTAFIDEQVPSVTENPDDYYGKKSTGALHRVVYNKDFLFKLLSDNGFVITNFKHQGIKRTLQSTVIAQLAD